MPMARRMPMSRGQWSPMFVQPFCEIYCCIYNCTHLSSVFLQLQSKCDVYGTQIAIAKRRWGDECVIHVRMSCYGIQVAISLDLKVCVSKYTFTDMNQLSQRQRSTLFALSNYTSMQSSQSSFLRQRYCRGHVLVLFSFEFHSKTGINMMLLASSFSS